MVRRGVWTSDEHDKFLLGIKRFPEGPWCEIAKIVGTRTPRQVQTHAQRYYEKIQRHKRGLQRDRSRSQHTEHRIDKEMVSIYEDVELQTAAPPMALPGKKRTRKTATAPRRCQQQRRRDSATGAPSQSPSPSQAPLPMAYPDDKCIPVEQRLMGPPEPAPTCGGYSGILQNSSNDDFPLHQQLASFQYGAELQAMALLDPWTLLPTTFAPLDSAGVDAIPSVDFCYDHGKGLRGTSTEAPQLSSMPVIV